MTKKIYYEKRGRRYVPVQEYDGDFMDSYSKGTHLLMVYPGGQSRRYNIDPNYAAMIAAGRVAEDAICRAISKASEMTLSMGSARDHAEAGVQAMQAEAVKLMTNPAVRLAYEQFLLVCELTKKQVDNA